MSRVALAPSRKRRAPRRALDGIFARQGSRRPEDGRVRSCRRGHQAALRPAPPACGCGAATGGGAAPGGLPPGRARQAAAPASAVAPTAPPAPGRGLARSHALSLDDFAILRRAPVHRPGGLARRRRALEAVEKVLTGSAIGQLRVLSRLMLDTLASLDA